VTICSSVNRLFFMGFVMTQPNLLTSSR